MEKVKKDKILQYFCIFLLIIIVLGYYNITLSKNEINKYQNIIDKYNIEITENLKEGKYLNDFIKIQSSGTKLKSEFQLLLIVDTIYCSSCFNYHIGEIQKLTSTEVYVYSPRNFDFVQSYLKKAKQLNFNQIGNDQLMSDNLAVALLNREGLIIYYEIADKNNYEKSEKFYNKLNYFLKYSVIEN